MTMTTASTPATPIATFEDILQVMEQNPASGRRCGTTSWTNSTANCPP